MLKLFEQIAAVGSPTEKVILLKSHPYQEELKSVLRLATDPFITYGVTSVEGDPRGDSDYLRVLKMCAERKLTGSEARRTLGSACLDAEDQEIVTRILRKDLRCGVGEKLVLQAYPGLIRQFEVMRADKFGGLGSRSNYFIEPKYDGLRCISIVEGGVVTLLSRNGKEFTSSNHLKPQILELVNGMDCVLDGELTSGNFNESSSAVRKKEAQDDSTILNVFDYLDMTEWENPVNPYYQRRHQLESLPWCGRTHLLLVPSRRVSSEEEAFKWYSHFLDQGYEGAILKNSSGPYRFKRHKDWMKLKEVNDVDLKVDHLIQGEGKYHGMLGAAVVKYKGKKVNVGSGFSDAEREAFWKDPTLIMGKVIEIRYHQETPDGSLRHPRFYKIREDKS